MAKQVKVVTDGDIGAGLEIVANKLQAAIDNDTITVEGGKLVAKAKADLRVTGMNAADGNLTVTVSDGQGGAPTTIQTTLASLLALSAEADNLAEKKADGIYVGKAAVKEAAKEVVADEAKKGATVEFQDLAGNTLGYAFETNA